MMRVATGVLLLLPLTSGFSRAPPLVVRPRAFAPACIAHGLHDEPPVALQLPEREGERRGERAPLDHATAARLSLALVAAAYGSNYACVKLMDEWVGTPAQAALLRFAVASAIAIPTLGYFAHTRKDLVSWPVARDGLSIGLCFGAGYIVQALALQTSSASLQAFLLSLSVIVCPLLDQLIGGKPQPARVWMAALIAVLGVGCLECGNLAAATLSQGDIIGLLQALFFGSGFWLCEKAIDRHRTVEHDMALPVALTSWNLVAVLAFASVWLAVESSGGYGTASVSGIDQLHALIDTVAAAPLDHLSLIGALLWTGIVTTAGCSFAEAGALGEISSADATVVFATEPLWGAFFAWAMIGEELGPSTVVGGLLMVLACVISGSDAVNPRTVAGAAVARVRKSLGRRE